MAGDGGGGHADGERTGRPVVVVLCARGRAARARVALVVAHERLGGRPRD